MDKRSRRRFTHECKAETVALIRQSGKSIAEVGRDMGLSESSVQRWLAQAAMGAGQRDGLTTAERDELFPMPARGARRARRAGCPGKSQRLVHQGADPVSRYRCIAEEKAHHSVALLWRVLHVAKSAFYACRHSGRLPELVPTITSATRSKRSTPTAAARPTGPP